MVSLPSSNIPGLKNTRFSWIIYDWLAFQSAILDYWRVMRIQPTPKCCLKSKWYYHLFTYDKATRILLMHIFMIQMLSQMLRMIIGGHVADVVAQPAPAQWDTPVEQSPKNRSVSLKKTSFLGIMQVTLTTNHDWTMTMLVTLTTSVTCDFHVTSG